MVKRDELIAFIYQTIGLDLIDKALVKDELVNGVQFLGGDSVKKVTLGVSLNEEFLENAVNKDSNFCIFHHAFDVRTYQSRYPLSSQKRLRLIYKNNITIVGFHYALDAHTEIGNNVTIIKKLGAKVGEPFWEEWGYTASFSKAEDIHDLAHTCQKLFDHEVLVVAGGPKRVKKIAIVSGGAKPHAENIAEMESRGVELFISGEASESTPHRMKESGINYFVCGHYATENFGVQELGKKITAHFGNKVKVEFIDIKNPI